MRWQFYIMMLNANPGLTIADIQARFPGDMQWYRIADNSWLVFTNMSVQQLAILFGPLATPSGTYFISQLDINGHQGLLPPAVWEWIERWRPFAGLFR